MRTMGLAETHKQLSHESVRRLSAGHLFMRFTSAEDMTLEHTHTHEKRFVIHPVRGHNFPKHSINAKRGGERKGPQTLSIIFSPKLHLFECQFPYEGEIAPLGPFSKQGF